MQQIIKIKPFSEEYTEQCADLLQYLWKEDKEGRLIRFNWSYTNNPNNEGKVIAVIAVNGEDQVVGFRGFHIQSMYFGTKKGRVAFMADTVVSPKARRQGIFQKMTEKSLTYLLENDIHCIPNLSPSWPPYYGYKKILFEDLHVFSSAYKFYPCSLFKQKILKLKRNLGNINHAIYKDKLYYQISTLAPADEILSQIKYNRNESQITPCRDLNTLKWKAMHPQAIYLYAYALDERNNLKTFLWFKTTDFFIFHLALCYTTDSKISNILYKIFTEVCKPSAVAVWDWAIETQMNKAITSIGFHKIPFINKIRKNPPALIRSLDINSNNEIEWCINGIDIRESKNWVFDKFECDSF